MLKNNPLHFDHFVQKTCDYGSMCQASDGSMPPGTNGPHGHRMTGARETSHWAILFTYAYQLTGNERYLTCANKAYDALLSSRFHPLDGAFWHRQEDSRSSYNGLIGQAWTLESLLHGWNALEREDLHACSQRLLGKYRFNDRKGLWIETDLDGSARKINRTLNQQVWFSAMAARCSDGNDARIYRFLDMLEGNAAAGKNGLYRIAVSKKNSFRNSIKRIRQAVHNSLFKDLRSGVDAGYHLFTLTGLAMLYEYYSSHQYFESKQFLKALHFAFTVKYADELKESSFGYQYNVPGFESPMSIRFLSRCFQANPANLFDSLWYFRWNRILTVTVTC
jgi:hypothetical protein